MLSKWGRKMFQRFSMVNYEFHSDNVIETLGEVRSNVKAQKRESDAAEVNSLAQYDALSLLTTPRHGISNQLKPLNNFELDAAEVKGLAGCVAFMQQHSGLVPSKNSALMMRRKNANEPSLRLPYQVGSLRRSTTSVLRKPRHGTSNQK